MDYENNKNDDLEIIESDVTKKQKETTPYDWAVKKARNQKTRKPKNSYAQAFLCALIIGGVGGGMTFGGYATGHALFADNETVITDTTTAQKTAADSATSPAVSSSLTVADIAEKCIPSVVSITSKGASETMDMFGINMEMESAGSGVVIGKNDSELLIATNYHVIEGANELMVCLNNSKESAYEADVKGFDAENDLAVIAVPVKEIDSDDLKGIAIATIAEGGNVAIGEQVVAIGNALGYGQSVTSGYISALDKEIQVDGGSTATLLQTDAAINPGNSGGALFNMKGELIGINTAKFSDTTVEGMGFAIPIDEAEPILEDLSSKETKSRLTENYGHLGIYGEDVGTQTAEMYGLPEGIYVSQVEKGSCSETAGLQKGDIITKFDGQAVTSLSELKNLLQYYEAGKTVSITYHRSDNGTYKEHTVKITLDSVASAEKRNTEQNADDDMFFRDFFEDVPEFSR